MWAYFTKEHYGGNPDKEAWAAQWLGLMQDNKYYCVVIEDEDGVQGFIDGELQYEPAYQEVHMVARHSWVNEDKRDKGYGLKLYRDFMRAAQHAGASKIITYSVDLDNHQNALIKKLFDKEPTVRHYEWVMDVE